MGSLTPADALKRLRSGQVAPVYLLHGNETAAALEILRAVRARWLAEDPLAQETTLDPGTDQLRRATLAARTLPFGGGRRLIVVRDATALSGKAAEAEERALVDYCAHPAPFSCLVVLAPAADARRRSVKAVEKAGVVVRCEPMSPADASAWLVAWARDRQLPLADGVIRRLVELVGTDLGELIQALDKAATYAEQGRPVDVAAVEAVVRRSSQETIFALLDALAQGRLERAHILLDEQLRAGEPPVRIAFMIARQVRLMIGALDLSSDGLAPAAVAQRLRQHPFAVQTALRHARGWSRQGLGQALAAVLEADLALKTGHDPRLVLTHLAARITLGSTSSRDMAPSFP